MSVIPAGNGDSLDQFNSVLRGIALPRDRKAQSRGDRKLPAGTVVVSVDNHWSLSEDLFYQRIPAHLKERAPRLVMREDGANQYFANGKLLVPAPSLNAFASFEALPGCTRIEPRLADMDVEGIDKEIVFGNGIASLYNFPDLEVREWVFKIYNQHLFEVQAKAPGRFYGVGLINFWDMRATRASIAELQALGLKTFVLPQHPKGADGAPLNYCSDEMAPLWEAIEQSGLPLCFHVGEVFQDGPGGHGTTSMMNFGPFRKNLGELIFGGILDRHPGLQIVFMEAEINWVPGALQTAIMTYQSMGPLLQPKIKHDPRHYWQTNCYTSFMHDPAGLRLLDLVGADRVMWSSDYPHLESTFGYSWSAMDEVVETVSAANARAMLGGTALKVFKLD